MRGRSSWYFADRIVWALVGLLLSVMFSCRQKAPAPPAVAPPARANIVVLLPEASGQTSVVTVRNQAGVAELNAPNSAVRWVDENSAPGTPVVLSEGEIRQIFSSALDAIPAEELSFNLYFNLGTTVLSAESEAILPSLLAAARERKTALVFITGHTDSSGNGRAANYRLGLQRAEFVAQRLRAIGVTPDMIVVGSHGQDDPLVSTPLGQEEPRNRRVEVILR